MRKCEPRLRQGYPEILKTIAGFWLGNCEINVGLAYHKCKNAAYNTYVNGK